MRGIPLFLVRHKFKILGAVCVLLAGVVFWGHVVCFYDLLTDREGVKAFILAQGAAAPLAFIGFQVLQVMFAPVPGEISGFLGGYLFGTTLGFVYSSIGLAVGSSVNFWVGRALGIRFVRRAIPPKTLTKLDAFISRQGIFVLLFFFVFPGFPKDYLCLLLGVTALPFKIFILLAGFGRMPGTLMLSLQGEFLFTENYGLFAAIVVIGLAAVGLAIRYRRTLYGWVEPPNKK
ncbi:MAG: TVP38/TMEM64 family protein [Desulfobacterales bacterium CG23_combo_of_CG06-09_8_20_14_all_51_8]|nr:MAG: TVP38/TMEM64 family protein [Desulfobacterales bacterium CG23_combo_of_CG06-09_8_20_14_all_51_8]